MKETFDSDPIFWQFTPFNGELGRCCANWRPGKNEVTMAKPEWGEKHRCSACGKPFYDMKKSPIICPSCGAENTPERLLKPRRSAPTTPSEAEKKAAAAKKKAAEVVDDDLEVDVDDEIDDDLIDPDTVDLADDDDDDDDLSGVVIKPKSDDES
jgi:hypothetical protein